VPPITTGLREIDAVSRALALASKELREREDALRENERRLRATYDNAAVGIIELDQDGRVLNVNEAHCKIMGRSRDKLIGRLFTETTHPDYRDRDVELFRQ
jgi:PAS domain-containing protein